MSKTIQTMGTGMTLHDQRAELRRLDYSIVSDTDYELVGVRSKWYWDAIATKLTTVVFVRSVPTLTAAGIRAGTDRMLIAARDLDPSRLPQGLQKNRATIALYFADTVEPDARQFCESPQPMRLAPLFYPAAIERSSGSVYYSKVTPLWGGVYYAKVRYLVRRLSERTSAPSTEPVSVFGVAMTVLVAALLLVGLAALGLAAAIGIASSR